MPDDAPSHRGDATAETTTTSKPGKRTRTPKPAKPAKAPKVPKPPKDPALKGAKRRQIGLVLASAHPRMAFTFFVGTVIASILIGRTFAASLVAGAAVLAVQLVAGLMNDVCDAELDRRAARPGKRIAAGEVPAGNATFIATLLFLLAVPLSLQSGVTAGLILLGTLVVAFLHNRALHRTPVSFLGWVVTLPMVASFVSYADREVEAAATAPPTQTLIALAFAGLCLHLITSLRDLPFDHKSGIKPLPLVIALKTGAPKLMYATIVLSLAAGVVLIIAALGPGLHR
ncbi:MAG: hypothetical protein EOO74_03125 [Myxococcales bacterium]|nr:MAG: hypothetical protein EOO74_03125 [Myxococcales bacterium]